MNTQKDTVAEVKRKGGDYVGALKGNQHNFYQDVKDYFTEDVIKEMKEKDSNSSDSRRFRSCLIVTDETLVA